VNAAKDLKRNHAQMAQFRSVKFLQLLERETEGEE